MSLNVEEIEQLLAEEIVQSLQEIRDNIKEMGREKAMRSHASVMLLMMAMKPESAAVFNTIIAFKLAELTAQRADS
jgi:hypothetical protein